MPNNLSIIILVLTAVALSGCTDSKPSEQIPNNVVTFDRSNLNLNARIVEVKFDRDDIRAGETVTARLLIANTGTEKITTETVEISAKLKTLDDSLANLYLKTMSDEKKTRTIPPINFNTEIQPGTVQSISAKFHTIKEMEGRSLAGSYDITIILSVNGQKVLASVIPITLYSGEVRNITPAATKSMNVPTPTPAPTPQIIRTEIPTPLPTHIPQPAPVIAATPTGKNVTAFVKNDRYYPSNLTIDAGDMVIWVNKMDCDYTIVEMDKKIPTIMLRARNSYIFNTTGDYRFGLYFKPMRGEPDIQTINVRVNAS